MGKFKKEDFLVKLLCLVASVGLWIYIINNVNPNRRTTFRDLRVQVKNAESLKAQNLILVPGQEFFVTLTIEGPANQVFTAIPSSFSLSLDLSDYALKAGINEIPLRTYDKIPDYTKVISSDQVLKVAVDALAEKSVDIKKDGLKYHPAEGYYVPEPQLDSTVAMISGPKTDVDKVAALMLQGEKNGIASNQKEVVKVIPVDDKMNEVPNITSSKSFVEVTYTALTVKTDVPVTLRTIQSNSEIFLRTQTPVPSKVSIAAKDSVLKNITEIQTTSLDLSMVSAGARDYPVSLIIPAEVTILDESGVPMDPLIAAHIVAEPLKSKMITKELAILGKPSSGNIIPVTLKININLSGVEADLDKLNEAQVTAGVDVTGLSIGSHTLPVKVVVPQGYTVVSTAPETVSVSIGP